MDVRNILRIGRLRQRFEKYMVAELKAKGYEDLAPGHAGIASTLYAYGPLPMSELALFVEKSKPTVTTLVNKMEKYQLVETKKTKADLRVTKVHLTEEGKVFAKVTLKLAYILKDKAVEGLSEEKQIIFTEVLEELLHNLEAYR